MLNPIHMKKIFIGLFASVLLLSACKELIEIEMPNAKPILVVEGEVTTEMDSSFVRLTLSTNYYQSEAVPIVQTANVSVNGVPFIYVPSLQKYKPAAGFVGKTDSVYQISINYENKLYKGETILYPMFRVDSFFQIWKEASGPLQAGYSLSYRLLLLV